MRTLKLTSLALLTVVAVLLAACSGGGPTPTPTTAPEPTDIPLSQSLTSENGEIALNYPEGWASHEDLGIIYLYSSAEASTQLGLGSLKAGQVFIQFAKNSILSGATSDPVAHLPEYVKLLAEGMGVTPSEPAAFSVGDLEAARTEGSNDKLTMAAFSIKADDGAFIDVIAYTAPGELPQHEPVIMGIVESIKYTPAQ